MDATLPDLKTEVLVRNMTLTSEEASAFRQLIGFNQPDSPLVRLQELGLASPSALTRLETGQPVNVTVIEDRNTCGLGYDKHDQKDRFDELCLSFGQDRTDVSAGKGGSYGLGKAVYEEASNCNMFVVYSVFEASTETDGHHARLFACATFDGHSWQGRKYTGRALFGVHKHRQGGQPECRPIVDDMAHEIAKKIGFTRLEDDHGTSLMIIGSSLDIDRLRNAVEHWWWPRLLSNKLAVELWVDDDPVDPPQALDVAHLKDHIACYTMIEHGARPEGGRSKKQVFRQFRNQLRPGVLALKGLEDDRVEDAENAIDETLENTVALIRSGPRMVVDYLSISGAGDRKYVGVFLGHSDADEALHLSEPPSHDRWNPNSQRLSDAYPADLDTRELLKSMVVSIMDRIRTHARNFLKELNPVQEPPAIRGSTRLQQILAQVISTRTLSPPPPPPAHSDPFEVRIRERRANGATESTVAATIRLGLREDAPMEAVEASVLIIAAVVMDDSMRRERSGRIALASMTVDGENAGAVVSKGRANVVVRKDEEIVIEVESSPFNREYYAHLNVVVETQPDGSAVGDGQALRPQDRESAS